MNSNEESLLGSVFGYDPELHYIVPDYDRPRAPSGNPRIKFACGVTSETSTRTIRATYVLDDVDCQACWEALQASRKA